jgi:glycosyltransferase involved in cell wall biosynthesis
MNKNSKFNKKLKIGLMGLAAKPIPTFAGNICAPNDLINNLAKELKGLGQEVYIFTGTDSKNELKKISAGLKSTWREYGSEQNNPIVYTQRRVEYDLILSTEAINMYKKGQLDVINSHDFRTSPYIFKLSKVPCLYTVHGDINNYTSRYDLYRYKLIRNSRIGLTNISKENIQNCKKLGLKSYGYTPNGIDIKKYSFNEKNRSGLLMVTRMIPEKKIKETIKTVIKAKEKITLIGPSGATKKQKEYFEELQKNYFKLSAVKYLGYKKPDQVIPYYQKAKILLYPSEGEGMPLTVLEAMACGLPVIASAVGGVKDIISDGKDGCLYNNPKTLFSKIKIAQNIDNRYCRKKIVENFSIQSMAKNYLLIYHKFINKMKSK